MISNKKYFNLNVNEYFIKRDVPSADYEESYWGSAIDPNGELRFMSSDEEREKKRILAKVELEFVNSCVPGKILDVGCGNGAILEGVSEKWEKYGVEISSYGSNLASNYCNVFNGTLIEASYPDDFFDVVMLFHVIEHMTDPVSEIIEIHRILKKDGFLIIGTPDFDSACARRFGEKYRMLHDITHTSLFSYEGLMRLVSDYGFKILYTEFSFFETDYFTHENLLRLFDTNQMSPPFYGNIMSMFLRKVTKEEAKSMLEYKLNIHKKLYK